MIRTTGTYLLLFLLILSGHGGIACKKRKLPTVDPDDPAPAAAKQPPPEKAMALRAPHAPGIPSAPGAPSPIPVAAPPLPGSKAAESGPPPPRSLEPVFGFPVPTALRVVSESPRTALYEATQSVETLRRFYRRELGGDARIVDRMYGFEVTGSGRSSLMVTQPPGEKTTSIAVIGPSAPQFVKQAPQ